MRWFAMMGVVLGAVALVPASGVVRAQEKTPQARISGAWLLNAGLSTPIPEPGASADSKGNKIGGGAGSSQSSADTNQLLMPGVKSLLLLMADICEVPRRMAITAGDTIMLIDDPGVPRRFTPSNKPEKIDYGTGKPSFRTRWDGSILVQDIAQDTIELTRTFETTPDGSRLTVTLTIKRQPDPQAVAAAGGRDEIRKYVYDRAS